MDLFTDILLIIVCAVACTYCFLLNKKLHTFSNMKEGLGSSIVQMHTAMDETNSTIQGLTDAATLASGSLGMEIEGAGKLKHQLSEMEENIQNKIDNLNADFETSISAQIARLEFVNEQSVNLLSDLQKANERFANLNKDQRNRADHTPYQSVDISSNSPFGALLSTSAKVNIAIRKEPREEKQHGGSYWVLDEPIKPQVSSALMPKDDDFLHSDTVNPS